MAASEGWLQELEAMVRFLDHHMCAYLAYVWQIMRFGVIYFVYVGHSIGDMVPLYVGIALIGIWASGNGCHT